MKRLLLSVLVVVVIMVGVLIALGRSKSLGPQPSYRGRTLSAWLDAMDDNPRPDDGPEQKAIRAIGTNGFPTLLRWLGEHDSTVRTWWVDLVGSQEWLPYQPSFARAHNEYATSAFRVLGTNAAPAAPALVRLLKHSDPVIRADAAVCLGDIGAAAGSAVFDLSRALVDTDEQARAQAAWALGQIHQAPARIVPLLLHELSNNPPSVQQEIASALGQFGSDAKSAVNALLRCLDGAGKSEKMDDDVRAAAAYSLGQIGEDAARVVPVLVASVHDQDAGVRRQSVQALGLFGDAARDGVSLLLQLLPESPDDAGEQDEEALAELRSSAAEALGEIQTDAETVVPALVASLRDSDAGARQLKAEALGKFGSDAQAALPALRNLFQDEDADVRAAATNAVEAINSDLGSPSSNSNDSKR
jgi:HEAT repeat protein